MNIIVSSKKLAPFHLETFKPDICISIVDPGDQHPIGLPEKTLKLKFDDIIFEPKSEIDKARYSPPTKEIVNDIYLFGEKNITKDSKVLIHCYAGISRSSAAAIISMTPLVGPKKSIDIVSELNVMISREKNEIGRNWFLPNNLMISYLDDMLCERGQLEKYILLRFRY